MQIATIGRPRALVPHQRLVGARAEHVTPRDARVAHLFLDHVGAVILHPAHVTAVRDPVISPERIIRHHQPGGGRRQPVLARIAIGRTARAREVTARVVGRRDRSGCGLLIQPISRVVAIDVISASERPGVVRRHLAHDLPCRIMAIGVALVDLSRAAAIMRQLRQLPHRVEGIARHRAVAARQARATAQVAIGETRQRQTAILPDRGHLAGHLIVIDHEEPVTPIMPCPPSRRVILHRPRPPVALIAHPTAQRIVTDVRHVRARVVRPRQPTKQIIGIGDVIFVGHALRHVLQR